MSELTAQEIKRIYQVYQKPFRYDADDQMIFDANNQRIIDVRGWGYLQYISDGSIIQDNLGKLIVKLLNEYKL